MLVISRRPLFYGTTRPQPEHLAAAFACTGHSVWIGPDIRVHVIRIVNGEVKLGIDAPREVHVWRDELEPR